MQPRVCQVEPVHDQAVVVSRRDVGRAREEVAVRPGKIDEASSLQVELWMLDNFVEAVTVVRQDLARESPWTQGVSASRYQISPSFDVLPSVC